jgi:formylglycine-generating enzyme required for sulfatase activity
MGTKRKAVLATALMALSMIYSSMSQATNSKGIKVHLKASESADAPAAETVQLYSASRALVIGIDDYSQGWPRLSNAVKDAELVASELRRHGFDVNLKTNLKSGALKKALEEFFVVDGAEEESRLFVWFAGHGFSDNGEGFLIPADAPLPESGPQFRLRALSLRRFGEFVRLAKAKHAFSVFDSCFSGTIFRVQRSRPSAAVTWSTALPVRQFLTSGDANEKVSDDGRFRKLFVRALRGEERADANGDGYLTASELGLFLEDRMVNLTDSAQRPRYGKLRDEKWDQGDFVFVLPDGGRLHGSPGSIGSPSSGTTAEIELWRSVQNSTNAAMFEEFLRQFPNGQAAGFARIKLEELQLRKMASLPPSISQTGPPKPPEPLFQVEDLDATYVAVKTANLREEPAADSGKVGQLRVDDGVSVTGKVLGRDWYRIGHAGGSAYVFAPLLKAIDAGELSAWLRMKGSDDVQDFESFLEFYPRGYFAVQAKAGLTTLRVTRKQESPSLVQSTSKRRAPKPVAPAPAPPAVKPVIGVNFRPGDTFRDCAECPEMVVIPSGRYRMGSETGHVNEKPIREVRIERPFAVGIFEVGFTEWEACRTAGGCGHRPADENWGRENRPVINVNWNDAVYFTKWLSQATGHNYRLLSEMEWEYVARAGTTTAYWWGDEVGVGNANCNDCVPTKPTRTSERGQFPGNPFGVHDFLGNAWEWVEDCYQESANITPPKNPGFARVSAMACMHVVRGGAWITPVWFLRTTSRGKEFYDLRNFAIGFRVARDID